MDLKKIIFFISLLSFTSLANDTYILKPHDTLSEVLSLLDLGPIYGKNGSLAKTLKLNPQLKKFNGNRVYPGMHIILPTGPKVEEPIPAISQGSKELLEDNSSQPDIKNNAFSNPIRSVASTKTLAHSDLGFALTNRFIRVDSIDTISNSHATLLSDSARGIRLNWGQRWDERLSSHLSFENYQVKIQDTNSSLIQLSNTKQNLSLYEFGFAYEIKNKFTPYVNLTYSEALVNRATNLTNIEISKFSFATIHSGLQYSLLESDELKLLSVTDLALAIPATQQNYQSELSTGYQLGLRLQDSISEFKLSSDMSYRKLYLKMKGAQFNTSEIFLSINLDKSF